MAKKAASKSLATIYATALYEAAVEGGALERVAAEVLAIRELLHKAPEVERFLISPTIDFANKRKAIEAGFSEFSKITTNFLLVLVDKGRAGVFDAIVHEFIDTMNRKEGIAEVQVHSARELADAEKARLIDVLAKKLSKKIKLDERVKPELLGGLVLIHEDKMWDGSVKYALERMIEKMDEVKLTTVKWHE